MYITHQIVNLQLKIIESGVPTSCTYEMAVLSPQNLHRKGWVKKFPDEL